MNCPRHKVQQRCRTSLWDQHGVSLGVCMEDNTGTGAGTRDPSCCCLTNCQRNRAWACVLHVPGTCLTLVAFCSDFCGMVYSGKHWAQVRISFLEGWEGSVLLTSGHGRVRQPGMGRAGMSWAARGRSGDNLSHGDRLEEDPRQKSAKRWCWGTHNEVGSNVEIPSREWREEQTM